MKFEVIKAAPVLLPPDTYALTLTKEEMLHMANIVNLLDDKGTFITDEDETVYTPNREAREMLSSLNKFLVPLDTTMYDNTFKEQTK